MRSKLLAVLCLLLLVSAVSATSTLENLNLAHSNGEIEFTDFAIYKLYLMFGDAERVPVQYAGDRDLPEGLTSGTTLLWDAQQCMAEGLFDEAQQADAELYLMSIRNTDVGSEYNLKRGYPTSAGQLFHYDTPEGNFRMWWCERGAHELDDYTDTDGDGVPDVVEDIAVGMEESFYIFIEELEFDMPIHDGEWELEYYPHHDYGYVEGDTQEDWERWDVYMRDIQDDAWEGQPFPGGVMAYCSQDTGYDYEGEQDPHNWNNDAFHMVFDCQAMGGGGQVAFDTAAHELHHGIQYGIEKSADRAYGGHAFEKTSVWSEDKAYPYSNAYISGRLPGFYNKPHIGIRGDNVWSPTGNLWTYDTVIWSHFIESLGIQHDGMASLMVEKDQVNAMTMTWEDYYSRRPDGTTWDYIEAHAEMWQDANPGVTFEEPRGAHGALFEEFVRWNWFTGDRKAIAGSGTADNNMGFYYIDDYNTYNPRDTNPQHYPMVGHAPASSREYTGTMITAGYYKEEFVASDDAVNARYCPDGLAAVYAHAIELNDLASGDDVVYAFRGDPANEENTRVWDGLCILMDSATVQDSSQTGDSPAVSMDMNVFGDRGIIRINDATQYHEIGLIPFIPVEVGKGNSIAQLIWVDTGEDHTAPSFNSGGGALTAGIRPGFGAHIEFIATPNEPLFACPSYMITLTTDADETYVYEVSGVNPLESWRFGNDTPWDNSDPQVYAATWNYPLDLKGTADVVMSACDAVGNLGTTTFDDFLSVARSGEETVVVGVNSNATLELPGNALEVGTPVTIMARPDVTSGKLSVETTLSSGSEAKAVLFDASVSREISSVNNGQSLHVVGYAYEVTAAGELTKSATLRIGYDDSGIDNEDKLALYRWNGEESSWDRLEALIDRQTNEVFTSISDFGVFAIGYSEFTVDEGGVDEAPRYAFSLEQNFPNPYICAGGETSINFTTTVDGAVKLSVYDLAGRLVNVLVDENLSAGHHSISWNGNASNGVSAQSGVYFYKLESTEKNASRRMVLIR